MRARAAYIHSLGTTGILVAAALMMLAVGSTIVAFDRWPGNGASGGAQSLPLETQAGAAADVKAAAAAPVRLVVHPHPSAGAAPPPKLSTAGLVKVVAAPAPVGGVRTVAVPGRPVLATPPPAPAPAPAPTPARTPRDQDPLPQPQPAPGPITGIGDQTVSQVETLIGGTVPQNPVSPLVQDVTQGTGAALPLDQVAGALR